MRSSEMHLSLFSLTLSLTLFFSSKRYWTIVTRPDQLTESKNQDVAERGALRPVEVVVPLPSHSVQQHQSSQHRFPCSLARPKSLRSYCTSLRLAGPYPTRVQLYITGLVTLSTCHFPASSLPIIPRNQTPSPQKKCSSPPPSRQSSSQSSGAPSPQTPQPATAAQSSSASKPAAASRQQTPWSTRARTTAAATAGRPTDATRSPPRTAARPF